MCGEGVRADGGGAALKYQMKGDEQPKRERNSSIDS